MADEKETEKFKNGFVLSALTLQIALSKGAEDQTVHDVSRLVALEMLERDGNADPEAALQGLLESGNQRLTACISDQVLKVVHRLIASGGKG